MNNRTSISSNKNPKNDYDNFYEISNEGLETNITQLFQQALIHYNNNDSSMFGHTKTAAINQLKNTTLSPKQQNEILSQFYYDLFLAQYNKSKFTEADNSFKLAAECISFTKKAPQTIHDKLLLLTKNFAAQYVAQENYAAAKKTLESLLTSEDKRAQFQKSTIMVLRNHYGLVLIKLGKKEQGIEQLQLARKYYAKNPPNNSPDLAAHYFITGQALEEIAPSQAIIELTVALNERLKYFIANKIDEKQQIYHQLLSQNNIAIARTYHRLAAIDPKLKSIFFVLAKAYYNAAKNNFKTLNDSDNVSNIEKNIADICNENILPSEYLTKTSEELLYIVEKFTDTNLHTLDYLAFTLLALAKAEKKLIHSCFIYLDVFYSEIDNNPFKEQPILSISLLKQTIVNDGTEIALQGHYRLGLAHFNLDQPQQAADAFCTAMNIAKTHKNHEAYTLLHDYYNLSLEKLAKDYLPSQTTSTQFHPNNPNNLNKNQTTTNNNSMIPSVNQGPNQ